MSKVIAQIYELEKEIGAGGGGIVYSGWHTRLNKKIVLKADKRTLKTKETSLRREVDLLKELRNDYIPQVFDFVQEDGVVYTVMDYIEGESLDKLLKRGERPSQPEVIKWACQLLEALCYLHSRPPYGILHGDIKPANIMLRPNGDICLIDFNIALSLGEEGAVKVGFSRGYASPEHYGVDYSNYKKQEMAEEDTQTAPEETVTEVDADDGMTRTDSEMSVDNVSQSGISRGAGWSKTAGEKRIIRLDKRSDIYSLGATLYHIISGIRPNESAMEVKPLGSEFCSPAVSEILAKAMAANPQERYQSAEEMLKAFRDLHKNDRRTVRQKRYTLYSTTALTLLFLAGGATAFVGLKQSEQQKEALALAEYSANALAEGDVSTAVEKAIEALPKEGLLNAEPTAQAQRALTDALGVYELSDKFQALDTITLPAEPFYMAESPTGKYLAVVYAYEMAIYHMETQECMVTLPVQQSALSECVFVGEERIVYAGESGLALYDIALKRTVWTGALTTTLSVSGDGSRVAAVQKNADKAQIYDTGTGELLVECSFDGKHQTVAENDIFANPNQDILAMNQDGSLLAASFSDGSLVIYDLKTPENTMMVYETSDYRNFQGGFCGKDFAYAMTNTSGAVFGIVDTKEGVSLGEYEAAEPFLLQAREDGIFLAKENLLVRFQPENGEETELAFTGNKKITNFAVGREYVLTVFDDNSFAVYDSGAHQISMEISTESLDFVGITNDFAILGSRNTPALRLLKRENHDDAVMAVYDAGYQHDEARVSADEKTQMLFGYQGFAVYDREGNLIAEEELPDAEQIYDQQFRKDAESYLEVIWYDGTVRCYSAADGKLLSETKNEAPDRSLDEEFVTDSYRITSSLHDAPKVYDLKTGKFITTLESESYLTYVTQKGKNLITEYVSAEGERYGLLLNDKFEILAYLPDLCDVTESGVIFDDGSGKLRQSRLYSLEELKKLGEIHIANK